MKINFKCDVCEYNAIEEVLDNVIQYSTITDVERLDKDTVMLKYGNSNNEFGEISYYQCVGCGRTLKNHGVNIQTPEELYEWLECNDMLKE